MGRSTTCPSPPGSWTSSSPHLVPETASSPIILATKTANFVHNAILRASNKLFFLPPYSPDLNPIEQVFAKHKTLLRKADERTVEATRKRIGSLRDQFSPAECTNYIKHAGHAST
ncbi:transposase [Acidocella sp.]|uniref:transposase n=1 Tax=Acidocella sp. TaxID=50710 RepID=UPI00345A0F0F